MSLQVDRRKDGSVALFIDGDLQFDSHDEANYHEALALPGLMIAANRSQGQLTAMIAGGGDGLTARELLKCPRLKNIDLVDLDPAVVTAAKTEFNWLNQDSLTNNRVNVHIEDAWAFAEKTISSGGRYNLIISDLTVPQDAAGTKMHSIEWYQLLVNLLAPGGIIAVNAVSPCNTPRAWWSIVKSIRIAGAHPRPYRVVVPSFTKLGYGPDWGFILASPQLIMRDELQDTTLLPSPRTVLKDSEQLNKFFQFPIELLEEEEDAAAAHNSSDILLHYLINDEPLTIAGQLWDSLDADFDRFAMAHAEDGLRTLTPEMRLALASSQAYEQTLFDNVIALVPGLNKTHSRKMISDFLSNPLRFLEAIDLQGLVLSLLARAAELPGQLVGELELLRDKLYDWSGDEHTLLSGGARVLSIIAVIVILSNLMYPDSVYAKGGDHGGHGGDHAGGRGGDHGDRGGRGDRGDRGDRGFNRGWGGDRYNHWSGWNRGGGWGGWARPAHGWYGGWGGGWAGLPVYGGGGGFINLNINKPTGQVVDEEGSVYPARTYNYQQEQDNQDQDSPAPSGDISSNVANVAPQQAEADFRLGPDADILAGGKVALQLTDGAYMQVGPTITKVINQSTGTSMISLSTDASLLAHLQSEIKRQSLGLQSANQSKQSSADWSASAGMNQDSSAANETPNIQGAVDLLNQAAQNLGPAVDPKSRPTPPPVPDSMEIFSSTWLTPDGKFVVIKRGDGSVAFMNARGWYSDAGTTPISAPYPQQFKALVLSYLQNLAKGSGAEQSRLQQEQQDTQDRLQSLQNKLQQLQSATPGSAGAQSGGPDISSAVSSDGNDADTPVATPEALRRVHQAINRTQHRLQSTTRQLERFPQETASINTAVTMLQGQ